MNQREDVEERKNMIAKARDERKKDQGSTKNGKKKVNK